MGELIQFIGAYAVALVVAGTVRAVANILRGETP